MGFEEDWGDDQGDVIVAELAPAPPPPGELECCDECGGLGVERRGNKQALVCEACHGDGYFGIDPTVPTRAKPGSPLRIAVMAARYRDGLPILHPEDAL